MYQRKNMNNHIDFQLPLTRLSTKNSESSILWIKKS